MFTQSLSYLGMAITLVAIMLVAVASYFILISSHRLTKFMGKAGLAALSMIMGFITLAIGVNFITSAIIALFKIG
jgi:multiple antibiotic resistance protein